MKKRVLSLFLALTLCLTLTPTGALAEESLPGQTVVATQETETPTPAPQKEESTAPAENGADENASPASPDEKPTENTPAAPEKNPADEEPGKEAGQNEPTAQGKNEPLALGLDDPGQNAAEGENGEGSGGTHYVAESGGKRYEKVQDILDNMEEEITLLDSVTEDLAVSAATTIHMNGHSITGNIDAMDSLTLTNGTVKGNVEVDGDTFTMTAPANAAAAIDGELNVISGSAYVSGAKIGVNGTLVFGGTDMTITGTERAVALNKAAEPKDVKLYGSTDVNGETSDEAVFNEEQSTYTVSGEAAKKLSTTQVNGEPEPEKPTLTINPTSANANAGETATFTATYTDTDTLNAYVQGSAVNGYFTISQKNNGDGTYTVSVKIDEETPGGTYTLFVHELRNTSVQASATITVTGLPDAAEVNGKQYKSLPRALAAAQNGDTVKLLADHVTDTDALKALGEDFTFEQYASIVPVVTKTLTLDLNHKTVDYLDVGFTETDDETQKKETLATGNLTVTGEGAYGRISNLMFMAGALDIRSGEIGGSEGAGLVCDVNSGTATISNGMVYGLTVLEGASVTVKNGFNHRGRWSVDSGGTLSITGGTFKDVQFVNSGTIAISGGTFEKISNNDTNTPQPLMLLLAKDCAFVNKNNTSDVQDGTKTSLTEVMVKEHTHTFENGKCACGVKAIVTDNNVNYYSTLQAALDAAANDNTITTVTLQQDLAGEEVKFRRAAAGALTLNMNGHKLEATAGVPLTVIGGELIIEGAGQVNQNTSSNAAAFPAISLTGGKLVITGDLTAQGGYDSSNGRKPAIRAEEEGELDLQGNVSLNGGLTILDNAKLTNLLTKGTFYAQDPDGKTTKDNVLAVYVQQEGAASDNYNTVLKLIADGYAIYKADGTVKNATTLTLNSDTYSIGAHTCNYTQDEAHGIAYCNCGRSHAHRDLSEEKSVLVNGVCPICGYHCPHKNIGDDGVCTDCKAKMVAKVTVGETTTYTADLADALNKAANGTTITLLANTMLPSDTYVSKTLTLDLDGHSLSGYSLNVGGLTPTSQVRTGNLTVIDSSGGNGAVGVTVRDGGTLVFDPKNDHTTLLQLEVWGGTVELYGGKISRSGLRLNNGITLGNLLPGQAGLAYYRDDTQLTQEEAASQTCDLVVKSCTHGGKNGFDNNSTACPYCGAPAVAETALNHGEGNRPWRRFADLQTALDADRDGGSTLYLLADVTGDYTIDGTQDTGLDLNGHSIKGTVTVKAAAGGNTTTLSNTKNTTTFSIDKVVAHKGAKLAGSGKPAVIGTLTLAEGATWNNILNGTALGYKVLNTDGTYKWYAPNDVKGSQLNNVIINRLPITSKTLNLKVDGTNVNGKKVERGTTVQLCAGCNANGATVEFSVLKKGETTPITLTEPSYASGKYTKDYSFDTIGEYTIYFTATKDGYTVTSSPKKLTVTKPNLSNAEITFRSSNESTYEPYNATTTAPSFTVTYNGKTLKLGVDYTASGTASPAGVSTQTLTIKAVEGSDYTGSKTAEWRIVPHKAKVEVGDVIKAYDGTTDLPDGKISLVSAAGSAGYQAGLPLPLSEGDGFELTDAKYDSADASETEKNISFTVKLTDTNYTFEDGTKEKAFTLKGSETDKTFKINQASVKSPGEITQLVFNDLAKTYTLNLAALLPRLSEGCAYGSIQYQGHNYNFTDNAYLDGNDAVSVSKEGVLTLSTVAASTAKVGDQIGTITVPVVTTNYQKFKFTINVVIGEKIWLDQSGVTVTATDITYGQTLADSTLTATGSMKCPRMKTEIPGTFAWTNPEAKPGAAGDYTASWTFTPAAGYEEYAPATGTVNVKVKPAKLTTVSVEASRAYYTGEAQIASITASGKSVDSTPVTFTYSDKVDGDYTSGGPTFTDAGTYTVYYKAEAANHEPATGTFTVTIDPLPISLLSVSSISKAYDGSADVALTADKLTFFSTTAKAMNIKLPNTALSFSEAKFTKQQADGSYLPSPEVGGGKALSFTMTLTSNNYVFEGKSEGTVSNVFATDEVNRFTITKAAAPMMQPIELTVINGLAKTYLVNLPALPTLGDNCKYGSIEYEACNFDLIGEGGYANSTATITSNDEFQLNVPAVESQTEGSVGTVGVKITTDNYQDMLLTVKVIAKNKIVPVPDGEITAEPITFGQILRVSTITGTMKDDGKTVEGTFEWTNPSTKPDKAGDYQAEWTFTPDAPEYATATGTVTIKVNKADPAFIAPTAQENLTYTGQEQALITAGSVKDYGPTMQYSLTEDGTYSQDIPTGTDAGTYTVWYRVFGDANHNDTAPASVTVSIGQKPLRITGVTAASKPYDGTTNADISSVTFDNVTLKRDTDYTVTASFDDASVGNGKNITATVTLIGQAAKNYALEQSGFLTTGNITAKQVTVTGITAKDKVYDGTTNATLDCSKVVLDGVLENDTLTVTAKGMFEKADVGEQKVTISDLTLDGNSANNYVLAESGNQTETIATITAKEVTVTPDNKSKVYQEKDPELTYIVSGVLSGETLKGITLARAEGENAGQYAITATADAGANPNYEVTFAKGTLTIEPKSIKGAKVVLGKGLTANGAEQTQTVEKVLLDDKEIPADSYTVAGNTATAPGRYTLTVTAKGNYTDSVEQIYAIAYKDTAVPSSSKPSSNNSSNDSETKKNEVAAPTPAPTPASTSKPSTITAMPQTGDTSNPTLYVVLLVASLLGLAVVFVCKKRNDK